MVSKIEDWHAPVLTAKHELFDTTIAIGNSLFTKLCPQYPNLAQLVNDILEKWVEEHVAIVDTRIDEAFKQEEDPFVSTDELANEIVKVRVERFDRALGHILKLSGTVSFAFTLFDHHGSGSNRLRLSAGPILSFCLLSIMLARHW